MEAKIRLDQSGSPYLEIAFKEPDMEQSGVQEDAEKLFFTQLKSNGGVLHVYNSRNDAKLTKVLVVSNIEKRGVYRISDGPLPTPFVPGPIQPTMPPRLAVPAPLPVQVTQQLPVADPVAIANEYIAEAAQTAGALNECLNPPEIQG